mgnify:CR=1 FL=1
MSAGCRIRRNFERPAKELVEAFRGIPVANIDDNCGRIAAVDASIFPLNPKARLLGTAFTVTHRQEITFCSMQHLIWHSLETLLYLQTKEV